MWLHHILFQKPKGHTLLPLWGKNQHEAFSKIRKYHVIQQSHFIIHIWRKRNHSLKKILPHHVHGNIYSQQPRYEKDLNICYGWVDKEDVGYIYNGILFSHKNKEMLPFVTTWMNLEGIMLSVIKKKQIKKSTNLFMESKKP